MDSKGLQAIKRTQSESMKLPCVGFESTTLAVPAMPVPTSAPLGYAVPRDCRRITCFSHWVKKYNSEGKDTNNFTSAIKNGGSHHETVETQLSLRIILLTTILASKLSVEHRGCFSGRFHRIFGVLMAGICSTS